MHLNGCHSKPRPTAETTYVAQDGWMDRPYGRVAVWVKIEHVMTTECMYSKLTRDPGCTGCPHINEAK